MNYERVAKASGFDLNTFFIFTSRLADWSSEMGYWSSEIEKKEAKYLDKQTVELSLRVFKYGEEKVYYWLIFYSADMLSTLINQLYESWDS